MSKKVLIADDDEVIKSILEAMLGSLGYTVSIVSTGAECLEHLSSNLVDILFLDYLLDDMSGGEVIQKIEQSLENKQNLKIILTTANSLEELEQMDPATKIDYYLAKPFDLAALKQVLTEVESTHQPL